MASTRRAQGPIRRPPTGRTATDEDWRPLPGRRTSILFDVFALSQQVRTLVTAVMRNAGMRADEYAAYSVLFEAGPITMTGMARELGMPVTTAADYVRAIQARGHLRRDAHPSDSRAYLLALTPAGTKAHKKANAYFESAYRALVRELPPLDEAATRETLQRLASSAARATASLS